MPDQPQITGTAGITITDSLTPRELEVARQVSLGLSNEAGAKRLGIERPTFAVHLQHVFKKLGVNNRAAVAGIIGRLEGEKS
jgi:DNA-binding CsgD family transcriptional regulator